MKVVMSSLLVASAVSCLHAYFTHGPEAIVAAMSFLAFGFAIALAVCK